MEMEKLRPELTQIKQYSEQILNLEKSKEEVIQQLNQYKSSVANYIHKIKRAESMLEMEDDPDLVLLTESTNQKVRTVEEKIQTFYDRIKQIDERYDFLFEQRRIIVNQVDKELNHTVTYAYPFGTESPTIRMGKFYHITEEGDVSCEMRFESNSFFNQDFHQVI